jgi:hypothetical protein
MISEKDYRMGFMEWMRDEYLDASGQPRVELEEAHNVWETDTCFHALAYDLAKTGAPDTSDIMDYIKHIEGSGYRVDDAVWPCLIRAFDQYRLSMELEAVMDGV